MKKKKSSESQPVWKKRQQEVRKEIRKAFFKKAVYITLGVLALGFLIWSAGRGLVTPPKKSKSKGPLSYALARVVDMKPVSNHGKPAVFVRFRAGDITLETTVDKKSAEKLKPGTEYSVSFYTEQYPGKHELHEWHPIKDSKVE